MRKPQPNRFGSAPRFAVFDLDDTLYAPECGLWAAISNRIDRYLVEHARVPLARVAAATNHTVLGWGALLPTASCWSACAVTRTRQTEFGASPRKYRCQCLRSGGINAAMRSS